MQSIVLPEFLVSEIEYNGIRTSFPSKLVQKSEFILYLGLRCVRFILFLKTHTKSLAWMNCFGKVSEIE